MAHYAEELAKYPARTVVVDLGCGEAALAHALVPKGITVLSYDLVSDGMYITEADICAQIPLPGSEPSEEGEPSGGVGHVVDVAVCALSLMGTNWPQCVREAWRILKNGCAYRSLCLLPSLYLLVCLSTRSGEFKIAEVASRFTDVDAFVKLVSSVGFRLESKVSTPLHFACYAA